MNANEERPNSRCAHRKWATLAGFVAFLALAYSLPREPAYNGKTATEWLNLKWKNQEELDAGLAEIKTAFAAMGPDAVLHFAKELAAGDSPFERTVEEMNRKVRGKKQKQPTLKERKQAAAMNLQSLGRYKLADLSPSVPYLIEQINSSSDQFRNHCLGALQYCDSHEKLVVPAMMDLLNSKDDATSIHAARVLANYPSSTEIAHNLFKQMLNHTNSLIFLHVSLVLHEMAPGQHTEWLAPKYALHLRSTNAQWRSDALLSLTITHPEDEVNISYATNLLSDTDPKVRARAIDRFSLLASQKPQYLPIPASNILNVCIASLDDSSVYVRETVLISLTYTWEEKATNALPKLEQLYKASSNSAPQKFSRSYLAEAIRKISPEKAKELGITGP